jgi:hypothetical protein
MQQITNPKNNRQLPKIKNDIGRKIATIRVIDTRGARLVPERTRLARRSGASSRNAENKRCISSRQRSLNRPRVPLITVNPVFGWKRSHY